MHGVTPVLGLLGISAASIVDAIFSALTTWIEQGAAAIVSDLAAALDTTTSVSFGSAFRGVFGSMQVVGGLFALPFLLAATIQAIVAADPGGLVRTLLVRTPVALVGSGCAIWLVEAGVTLTDEISDGLLEGANGDGTHFVTNLASVLTSAHSLPGGFVGVLCALLTAAVAFFVWIELAIRSAAVLCASMFIPLALAGVIWPATSHWIRRLGELLAALVLAKLAIVAVLVLGVTSVGTASGISGVVEGMALLLLCAFAPFALFRLIPFVAHDGVSGLDGIGGRARHTAFAAARSVDLGRVRQLFGGGGGGDADLVPNRAPLGYVRGEPMDEEVFRTAQSEILRGFGDLDRGRSTGEHTPDGVERGRSTGEHTPDGVE